MEPIKRVQVVSPRQLVFHLTRPYSPLPTTALSQLLIVPKHIWVKVKNIQSYQNVPAVGSGPFKWDFWNRGQNFGFLANKKHFTHPKIHLLEGIAYADQNAVFRALTKQEIDIEQASMLIQNWEAAAKYPFLKRSKSNDVGVYYIGFNLRKPPFNTKAFRLAIAHTIPYQQFLHALFKGTAIAGAGFVPPANKYWHNPHLTVYPYNLAQAKAILKKAGYVMKDGKLYMPE
jgi:peptide/nickel transport system substrate-binding protein